MSVDQLDDLRATVRAGVERRRRRELCGWLVVIAMAGVELAALLWITS